MRTTEFYPLIQVANVEETAAFYIANFGFKPMFESDWYYHLQSVSDPSLNIAILQANHETIPADARGPTKNLILSFEVDDIDAETERLSAAGVTVAQPLRDEPHGQRHTIFKDPNGVLIDLITPIEPSAEFLEGYAEAAM